LSWADSLIRISTYEVEVIQKRMAEVQERRVAAETKRAMLEAEGEAEAQWARNDPEAAWSHAGYVEGLRARKAAADAVIAQIALEEQGVRDALNLAFETQKKYEHVAEAAKLQQRKAADRLEAAQFDELGLRRASIR
jgi:flagellar FliJ protein